MYLESKSTGSKPVGVSDTEFPDDDECKDETHNCDYECINLPGSYNCVCREGQDLLPNGKKCVNVVKHEETTFLLPRTFQSPNYPAQYPALSIVTWLLTSKLGSSVHIEFNDFHLESSDNCTLDHLAIYDGENTQSILLGKLCGNKQPPAIASSGSQMYLVFKSDASVRAKGFNVTFRTYISRTEHQSSIRPSYIASSDYQSENSTIHAHSWLLTSTNEYPVHIEFDDFLLEESENCSVDYLEIFDGNNETNPVVDKFCGKEIPPPVWATGKHLLLVLNSQSLLPDKGFNISHMASCGGKIVAREVCRTLSFQLEAGSQLRRSGQLCVWTVEAKKFLHC